MLPMLSALRCAPAARVLQLVRFASSRVLGMGGAGGVASATRAPAAATANRERGSPGSRATPAAAAAARASTSPAARQGLPRAAAWRSRAPSPSLASPAAVDFRAMNAEIQSARSAAALRSLVSARAADFGAMQYSMVCAACARLGARDPDAGATCALAAHAWLGSPRGSLARDTPRGAVTVFYALARTMVHQLVDTQLLRINVRRLIADVGRESSALSREFSAQDAANGLSAAAKLGMRDEAIVGPLAAACAAQARTFNAQDAADSLFAAAKLGLRDAAVVGPLAAACVAQSRALTVEGAAICLWAAAALGVRDEPLLRALASAFRPAAPSSLLPTHCAQVLYAHAASCRWLPGPALFSPELLAACRARAAPTLERKASRSQAEGAASLARLGHAIEHNARVLDGLLAVDALVQLPGGGARVAVEFDGPSDFLRWFEPAARGSAEEPNGATRLRDRLLREGGLAVLAVPYFEWRRLGSDAARDAYRAERLAAVAQALPDA
jgi:hypothetical protein